jgi:glycosyltransferase involved in cell wall biosynthesis
MGGALDTVKENVTGLFFDEQTPESLIVAMERFEKNEEQFANRSQFTSHVQQFSKDEFKKRIQRVLEKKEIM